MINVIHVNDPMSFDLMLFPEQSPMNQVYLANQFNSFGQTLTDIGRQFMESTQALYEKVNDSTVIRMAKAAIRNVKGMFHPNDIVSLESVEDLRMASPMMQRYIMAEPTIRALYHKQQCDGYSDTYADVEPGLIKEAHYDYRRVMTGIIVDEKDEDGNDSWISRNFYDDMRPQDRDLTIDEKPGTMNNGLNWCFPPVFVCIYQLHGILSLQNGSALELLIP